MHPEPKEGRCNAKTRDGGHCRSWPTRLNGRRCRMHGGAPGSGRPPIHGRYAKILRKEIRGVYLDMLHDEPDHTSTVEEIALSRALLAEYLNRFQSGTLQSREEINQTVSWLDTISKLANRASLIESRSALTARHIAFLETMIIRLLSEYLSPDQRVEFGRRLSEMIQTMPIMLVSESERSD